MKIKLNHTVVFVLSLVFFAASGCTTMPPPPSVPVRDMPVVNAMEKFRPLALGKIVVRIPRGKLIGGLYEDVICYRVAKLKYNQSGSLHVDPVLFEDVFREDMNSAGFAVAGNPDNLFTDDGLTYNDAEYIVGALIKDADIHICNPLSGFYSDAVKGWAHLKVNWQFFSSLEQRVVYDTTTEGLFNEREKNNEIDELDFWRNAFSGAVQNLMADRGFLKLVSSKTIVGTKHEKFGDIIFIKPPHISSSPLPDHMPQARDAAVLIHIGSSAHGSGFFVDKSGYILTNRHVTGTAKRITVELSTGRKLVADVIRSDAQRDIALLKVEDGVYPALPLRLEEPEIGSEVYAIGAPLRKKLKFTVTRGIVSAYRERHGQVILQSDVNIQGGNSGGPLLDADGNVVAVCVIAYLNAQRQNFGANGFIPIKSALDALNIKIK